MCAYVAGECENCGKVYLENSLPVIIWELMGWVAALDSTAIEEDVDSMAVFKNCRD